MTVSRVTNLGLTGSAKEKSLLNASGTGRNTYTGYTGSPTITTNGTKTVVKFNGSGSITVTSGLAEVFMVGGGGSGGVNAGGGGEGGGYYHGTATYLPAGTWTVTVGNGGSQTNLSSCANAGGNTTISAGSITYTANGGGRGGGASCGATGGGGSGAAVGGDGAGGANSGTNGGIGISNSITGTATYYGGGGGGSGFTTWSPPYGTGGLGGGGNGGSGNSNGSAGTANLGGGGGGGYEVTAARGGAGGSGVVIFSFGS